MNSTAKPDCEQLLHRVSNLERAMSRLEREFEQFIPTFTRMSLALTAIDPATAMEHATQMLRTAHNKAAILGVIDGTLADARPDIPEDLKRMLHGGAILHKLMNASANAARRLRSDPKQSAKADAFKLWQDWRAGRALYKSGAAFARHVVDALPAIENTKTVERWVTQWRKDAKAAK